MKRREFLAGCGSALAITGLGAGGVAAAQFSPSFAPEHLLTKAEWEGLLNQSFYVYNANSGVGVVTITLVAVREAVIDPLLDQYTVSFQGSPLESIAEGLYTVEYPGIDQFQLHLQPTDSDTTSAYYRSEFSLLK